MQYQATETQLEGDRSQLLYVLSAGNCDDRFEILSVNGSRPNGIAPSRYSKTSSPGELLLASLSSLDEPMQGFSSKEALYKF